MFDEMMETLNRERLRNLQLSRLRNLIDRLLVSPNDRPRLRSLGLTSGEDVDLNTLKRLPFTTKDDVVDRYQVAETLVDEIVEWHGSSGTGGRETLIPYTRRDIKTWGALCARLLVSAGISEKSIVANAYGYGLFTGGLGYHYGLGCVGASVVPLGLGPMARLVRLMRDMQIDTLACTPTYASRILEYLKVTGMDPRESMNLCVGVFGAETFSEEMRGALETGLGLCAFDLYGLSEVTGPGVAGECRERAGLHVNEDHFLLEVIDPTTGKECADGVTGEVVLTTLSKEAKPVLRYRTGDLASVSHHLCPCRRTFARISRIQGRLDDMVIINGVNIFPRDIEEVVFASPHLSGEFIVVLSEHGSRAVVACESAGMDREARYEVEAALAARLGIAVRAATIPQGSLERGDMKRGRRVITAGTPEASSLLNQLEL
ncbi:phenylacetate--CoA ligase family protein [Amycolatopsis cihanbeyliensis]|uniref:Phenylacetate-CoA ligase n=1 Tax=Amycolatopsis cihanbeyliensis TaxID=1128664 RepID=A0A542DF11_AMYCI|nr:AMP-binding protein [Amycolatopsis cihanbeyliensis]TQJ01654.1 phenylacetate-CoA ligase [Amycolatopsis cihanbeyliensis]